MRDIGKAFFSKWDLSEDQNMIRSYLGTELGEGTHQAEVARRDRVCSVGETQVPCGWREQGFELET